MNRGTKFFGDVEMDLHTFSSRESEQSDDKIITKLN